MEVPDDFVINTLTTLRQLSIREQAGLIRDYNHQCGYPDSLDITHYKDFYDRRGIGTRVVQLWPIECWQVQPRVIENNDTDTSNFEEAINDLNTKVSLFSFLKRIDILSGIGRFGILLLGLDKGKLRSPTSKADDLLYLRAFDESVINIKSTELNPNNPRYGHPIAYNVTMKGLQGQDQHTKEIHYTRVIHIADNRESDEIFGTPRLQPVYDQIHDIRKVGGGSAEMFWKGGYPGTAITLDPKIDIDNANIDTDSIKDEVSKYFEGLKRYMVITGAQATNLTPNIADPGSHFDVLLKQISIAIGVPQRVLLGTEAAKLSSVQDKKTWYGRVKERQENYLTPFVVRPTVDRLIELGVLPKPAKGYRVEWPDIEQPGEEDRVKVAKQITEAISAYISSKAYKLLPPKVYFKLVHKLKDEDIRLIEQNMEDLSELDEMEVKEQTEEDKIPDPGNPEDDNSKLEL